MATFQPSAPSSRHTEKYVAVVRNSSFRYDNLQRETNSFFSLKKHDNNHVHTYGLWKKYGVYFENWLFIYSGKGEHLGVFLSI